MNANEKNVPDWKLERYLLGELPKRELEEIVRLAASDEALRGRIDALRADNAALLAQYPPEVMLAKIRCAAAAAAGVGADNNADNNVVRQRAKIASSGGPGVAGGRNAVRGIPSSSRNWWSVPQWAIPAFACAALFVVVSMQIIPQLVEFIPQSEFGDRVKGVSPALEVWRKAGESAERLAPEAVARAGDIVQLRYVVPKPCYGALVSVDGRGVLTVHLSGDSGKAAPLTPGRPIALGNSYQLDDAPDFETFYLITSAYNFDVNSAVEALKIAGYRLDAKGEGGTVLAGKRQITGFTLLKSYDRAGMGH